MLRYVECHQYLRVLQYSLTNYYFNQQIKIIHFKNYYLFMGYNIILLGQYIFYNCSVVIHAYLYYIINELILYY